MEESSGRVGTIQALRAKEPAEEPRPSLLALMSPKLKAVLLGVAAIPLALSLASNSPGPSSARASSAASVQVGQLERSASAIAAPPKQEASARTAAPELEDRRAVDPFEKAFGGDGSGMSNQQIASAMLQIDSFLALASAVEDFKSKPYVDPGGLNVGFGYCVTKRLAEYGSKRVRSDLESAGFAPEEVDALAALNKAKSSRIKVTPLQAAKLLEATKPDYAALASGALGSPLYESIHEDRKNALAYIAYNTGDLGKFPKLLQAVRSGNDKEAMLNFVVRWRDTDGVYHENHRLRSYVQALYLGKSHLEEAIKDPQAFEGHMAGEAAMPALAEIAKAAQNPDGLRSKLLERRMRENPWAFNALKREQNSKAPGA